MQCNARSGFLIHMRKSFSINPSSIRICLFPNSSRISCPNSSRISCPNSGRIRTPSFIRSLNVLVWF